MRQDSETDADTDTDTDTDTDSDTDADSDSDSDTDTDADTDCTRDPPAVRNEGECVTTEVYCGENVIGTTKGGLTNFDSDDYTAWFCSGVPDKYKGPERVFLFEHPGDSDNVDITLTSECDDLDLFVFQWEYWTSEAYCPSEANAISNCDDATGNGGGTVRIWDNRASHYFIVIDGKEMVEDQFKLYIDCDP